MSTSNAVGFFLFGIALFFAPAFFPGYFGSTVLDGSSASALWLMVMGLFQSSLGIIFVVHNEAVPFAMRLLTLRFPTFKPSEQALPELVVRRIQRA